MQISKSITSYFQLHYYYYYYYYLQVDKKQRLAQVFDPLLLFHM